MISASDVAFTRFLLGPRRRGRGMARRRLFYKLPRVYEMASVTPTEDERFTPSPEKFFRFNKLSIYRGGVILTP